ncbi:hypothetical protein [Sphingobium sp. D43FB]|uniref:hypothetical protein n=1 Tax=Sphingobium sp. D43FB TaxID=2017595 RepID=UPI00114353FA|nr:hypothetical protein [Sphingobium sp. D43FB]
MSFAGVRSAITPARQTSTRRELTMAARAVPCPSGWLAQQHRVADDQQQASRHGEPEFAAAGQQCDDQAAAVQRGSGSDQHYPEASIGNIWDSR